MTSNGVTTRRAHLLKPGDVICEAGSPRRVITEVDLTRGDYVGLRVEGRSNRITYALDDSVHILAGEDR